MPKTLMEMLPAVAMIISMLVLQISLLVEKLTGPFVHGCRLKVARIMVGLGQSILVSQQRVRQAVHFSLQSLTLQARLVLVEQMQILLMSTPTVDLIIQHGLIPVLALERGCITALCGPQQARLVSTKMEPLTVVTHLLLRLLPLPKSRLSVPVGRVVVTTRFGMDFSMR